MDTHQYVNRGGVDGRERLRLLSDVFRHSTRSLVARIGLSPGLRCVDLGCGGGDVTVELARAIAPDGYVIGVDFDAAELELAPRESEQRG